MPTTSGLNPGRCRAARARSTPHAVTAPTQASYWAFAAGRSPVHPWLIRNTSVIPAASAKVRRVWSDISPSGVVAPLGAGRVEPDQVVPGAAGGGGDAGDGRLQSGDIQPGDFVSTGVCPPAVDAMSLVDEKQSDRCRRP